MKHSTTCKLFLVSILSFLLFALWTLAISHLDVRPIAPDGSGVGFAALNATFHARTGVHMALYTLTDWLGLVPVGIMAGFAALGLAEWIRRRSLFRVDASLLVLGGYYVLVLAAYLIFESLSLNVRPVLIDGFAEASYPSSTTLLVLTVIPTAILQLRRRMPRRAWYALSVILAVFALFMVGARTAAGVHWLTDIVGGILLSAGLVALYAAVTGLISHETTKENL